MRQQYLGNRHDAHTPHDALNTRVILGYWLPARCLPLVLVVVRVGLVEAVLLIKVHAGQVYRVAGWLYWHLGVLKKGSVRIVLEDNRQISIVWIALLKSVTLTEFQYSPCYTGCCLCRSWL